MTVSDDDMNHAKYFSRWSDERMMQCIVPVISKLVLELTKDVSNARYPAQYMSVSIVSTFVLSDGSTGVSVGPLRGLIPSSLTVRPFRVHFQSILCNRRKLLI